MFEYNGFYWIYIIGGNACYFLILAVWRAILQRAVRGYKQKQRNT